MSKFDDDMARGCLPTGEPLECAYGVGWWTEMPEEEPEPEPELKPCPFCGWEFAEHAWNEFGEEYRVCDQCGASSGTVDSKWDWQSRPIEDALTARIAELEALVVSLGDALTATYNSLPTHWRDHYHCPYSYTGLMLEIKKLKVKDWKERELGWN